MQTQYYTYGNIIRILNHDEADSSKSFMIDINSDDESILSVFDASLRPYDRIFIQSFINILNQSTVGFTPTDSPSIISKANDIISANFSHIKI